ncbi:branched-chain amino acid aminotransferase II [Artomyces pyxidatus]|uniref:Branched-chain amino acid aminotransferase II n=1 Tax=Artomyces pyxidatus TaxID=48021 RepID=A0ACB8SJP6_9AGAM|nr:branched-chain amino acid aminotransferase II [Artomyces pyxidatus]
MAIEKTEPLNANGMPLPTADLQVLKNGLPPTISDIDPSRLTVTHSSSSKDIPLSDDLVFGQVMTDHMLYMTYEPTHGWSAPEIKPYGPLSLDPASSCFQYCPNVFEGMKAYLGPDGTPRLFRPQLNMARMMRSADRVALPHFDTDALLVLIKKLITIDARWIPKARGCSLYIRPTIIGTRAALGVAASTHATLYVIMSPTGPYFKVPSGISLYAVSEHVRAWPGGTGGYKLGLNYAPGFQPQRTAMQKGYQQVLWLLGETITEAGAMNFFVVLKRDDGDLDIVTPPLDGTILPGVTRASVLSLLAAHPVATSLPNLSNGVRLHTHERAITMSELVGWHAGGRLLEVFCVGTAVVVTAVSRIGWEEREIALPEYGGKGIGPVARALWERLVDIQEGRVEWQGWSVPCEIPGTELRLFRLFSTIRTGQMV